jgi:hypothetical protein
MISYSYHKFNIIGNRVQNIRLIDGGLDAAVTLQIAFQIGD